MIFLLRSLVLFACTARNPPLILQPHSTTDGRIVDSAATLSTAALRTPSDEGNLSAPPNTLSLRARYLRGPTLGIAREADAESHPTSGGAAEWSHYVRTCGKGCATRPPAGGPSSDSSDAVCRLCALSFFLPARACVACGVFCASALHRGRRVCAMCVLANE